MDTKGKIRQEVQEKLKEIEWLGGNVFVNDYPKGLDKYLFVVFEDEIIKEIRGIRPRTEIRTLPFSIQTGIAKQKVKDADVFLDCLSNEVENKINELMLDTKTMLDIRFSKSMRGVDVTTSTPIVFMSVEFECDYLKDYSLIDNSNELSSFFMEGLCQ